MKIKLLFFLVFLLVIHAIPVFSIEVGGHIIADTIWSPENNPYHVISNIYVDSGVTLTILPGTVIEIASARLQIHMDIFNFEWGEEEPVAKMFWIDGKIIAEGTEQDSIIFTRDQNIEYYRWGTILLSEDSQEVSKFKHCKIEFAHMIGLGLSDEFNGGICVDNGRVDVQNCLLKDNTKYGITFWKSVYPSLIKNNTFISNETFYEGIGLAVSFISIKAYNNVHFPTSIVGNRFFENIAINSFEGVLNLAYNQYYGEGKFIVMDINEGNFGIPAYIYGNKLFEFDSGYSNAPIYIRDSGTDTVYVKNNELSGKGCGIYSTESNVEISQNVLDSCHINTDSNSEGSVFNNIVQNSSLNRGGITGGKADVTNNIVKNCKIGCSFWASREKVVKNNIFINNQYAFNHLLGNQIIENNIIIDNTYLKNNNDVYNHPLFRNNVLDFPIPNYCIDAGGNLWQDPMFVDAENGDYHLLPGSPCIDAGFDTLASYYPQFDLDHNFRIWDGTGNDTARIDIGVYEYGSQYTGGIEGTVYIYDSEDEPLDYVLLKINNQNSHFEFADSAGFYHFDLQPGTYSLHAERVFYEDTVIDTIEVVAGQVTPVDFFMVNTTTGITYEPMNLPTPKPILYNYPNPFNPSTTIAYQLPQTTEIFLKIYDVMGRLVKTLVDDRKDAGYHTVTWNGEDNNGSKIPSGIYYYRLEGNGYNETRQMILLK